MSSESTAAIYMSSEEASKSSSSKKKLVDAFFRGKIRDSTTKESRKAAESLAALKTIRKNPSWVPVDSRTKMLKQSSKAGLPPAELSKMRAQIGETVPDTIISDVMRDIAEAKQSATLPQKQQHQQQIQTGHNNNNNNATLCDVEAEIHRRIQALGKSGNMFEEHAAYNHDHQLAADAPLIVQGIDPQAARSEDRYVRSRVVIPQRKHWMASKIGYYMTQYGIAYVHTDGSVAMFPCSGSSSSGGGGREYKCRCGVVHVVG